MIVNDSFFTSATKFGSQNFQIFTLSIVFTRMYVEMLQLFTSCVLNYSMRFCFCNVYGDFKFRVKLYVDNFNLFMHPS